MVGDHAANADMSLLWLLYKTKWINTNTNSKVMIEENVTNISYTKVLNQVLRILEEISVAFGCYLIWAKWLVMAFNWVSKEFMQCQHNEWNNYEDL